MSCLREVQTISKSPNILPMPSLTRLTTGGVLNPLKNTTKIGHNKLLHQEPLQPPLEPSTATTAHPQPPPRPAQTPIDYDLARTQQPHATPARPSAAPPPRLGHANGGFYYHRRLSTACRRRVAALWSQFPPRTHPQPPTLRPSNNAAPRTPLATPIHNLATAAFADATSTPSTPTGAFTTIDTSPRRVAGVSQPYGRNSPHTPTHNHQPCPRATTQHPAHPAPRPYTTSPPQHSQTPPRHHPRQRGLLLP